jgi:hypothetical protein
VYRELSQTAIQKYVFLFVIDLPSVQIGLCVCVCVFVCLGVCVCVRVYILSVLNIIKPDIFSRQTLYRSKRMPFCYLITQNSYSL